MLRRCRPARIGPSVACTASRSGGETGAVLRPRSGARALGAGPRKQIRRVARESLPSDYPRLLWMRERTSGNRPRWIASVGWGHHVNELAGDLDHAARG